MNYETIARVAHEVNRAYCAACGDLSQPAWEDAPEWQRKSAINGVAFHAANPDASPSASHESWLAEKRADGWSYGPVKDPAKKEHPCFVPYEQLPVEQKVKDYLFSAVCRQMLSQLVESTSDQRTVNNHLRHQYRVLTDDEKALVAEIKDKGAEFIDLLHKAGATGPYDRFGAHGGDPNRFGSRNLALAFGHIEDAVYRAVKHVTE